MEFCGRPVQLVEGPACNIKVTYDGDLAVAAAWLSDGFRAAQDR
jgi:2-C-methyl-D-erythritol 4-phosphate cytidylyltransferase